MPAEQEWKKRSRVRWDALDMEKYHYNVEDGDQGTGASVVDMAHAIVEVQFNDVWAWAMHFGFSQT